MRQFGLGLLVFACVGFLYADYSHAVRIMTSPATEFGSPSLQFDNITLTPDGISIVATGLFNNALTTDRIYSLTIPADPLTQTATLTQLSTSSFVVNSYDAAFAPVVSPNGQTILFVHNGNSLAQNTIHKMPITGEGSSNFTGFFGADPNLASPGNGNSHPIYSSDGSTVFFLNNNAGFGGSIPIFSTSPVPFAPAPDWDQIYSVPAAGGTPTAITLPGHGDVDGGLFALIPNGSALVYSPAQPVAEGTDRSGIRSKLFSIPSTGGSPTEISFPAPSHDFSIKSQLSVTPDGQSLLFIADYETIGKNELYSLPIGGGVPTRISDDLPFAGDVYSFAISPNGSSVAYAAGQNVSGNSELFLTPITGGTGNSIRVSEPATVNSGVFDVSTSAEGGQIVFSPDSTKIYYLGDLDTDDVNDLYVVDTTAKAGLVPSAFTFVGSSGGDFFDESNWQDAEGNPAPDDSINPGSPIRHSLVIDGDTVGTSGGEADFQVGGSLELLPGSVLNFPSPGDGLDFNPGSGLKLADATIQVYEDIFLEGTNHLVGGLIESTNDDIEFQDGHETSINGTTLRSTLDIMVFDNSATAITGAVLDIADRLSLRYEVDVIVTDTVINVRGFVPGQHPGGDGHGDVEDAFVGAQGAGSTLTLKGDSTLFANAIQDGVSLVIDGTSTATLLSHPTENNALVDSDGTITFMSTGAEMIMLNDSAVDVRAQVINGLTGLSYLADPSAWNITNWDGMSPLASLKLVGGVDGDFDGDGDVDGRDFLIWQRGGSPTPLSASDLAAWQANYGAAPPLAAGDVMVVPEPSGALMILIGLVTMRTSVVRRASTRRSGSC